MEELLTAENKIGHVMFEVSTGRLLFARVIAASRTVELLRRRDKTHWPKQLIGVTSHWQEAQQCQASGCSQGYPPEAQTIGVVGGLREQKHKNTVFAPTTQLSTVRIVFAAQTQL